MQPDTNKPLLLQPKYSRWLILLFSCLYGSVIFAVWFSSVWLTLKIVLTTALSAKYLYDIWRYALLKHATGVEYLLFDPADKSEIKFKSGETVEVKLHSQVMISRYLTILKFTTREGVIRSILFFPDSECSAALQELRYRLTMSQFTTQQ